jgi:TatD DNase family protein
MAGIYDTHCHLNDNLYIELELSSPELVRDSAAVGIDILNNVGFDVKSSKLAVLQAEKNPNVYAVIGIHPNDVQLFSEVAYQQIDELANATKVVAIGEIGLDYTRTDRYMEIQKEAFKTQIEIALAHKLPVVLHFNDLKGSKQAWEDGLKILKKYPGLTGVVHSFSSD